MKRLLAIAVLAAQMLAGVCVIYASGPQRAECPCCEGGAMAGGSVTNACCLVDTAALPGLEASAPFSVTPPQRAPVGRASSTEKPAICEKRFRLTSECLISSPPPKLYLRNSILLI